MSVRAVDSALPVAFRVFLEEVHRVERRIRGKLAGGASAAAPDARPVEPDVLRADLADFLRQQRGAAQAQGRDTASGSFRQAEYLMAALADATFDGFDWWGRRAWHAKPLAEDFPPPDGMDRDVMMQLAALLDSDLPDLEMAQIFLLVLAVGVPGEPPDPALAESCRLRLFRLLSERLPDLAGEGDRIFPEAYQRRQSRGPTTYLPPVRSWLLAFLILSGILLAASIPVWREATAGARTLVERIMAPE